MSLRERWSALKRELSAVRTPGSFVRNALFTSADAVVNIVLQVVFTPILARLYSPEAYGVYGLFSSITSNLASISSLGYPLAFALPKDEERFHGLVRVSWWLLLATVVLCVPFFFPDLLYGWIPSWSVMGDWCMAVPLTVAVVGAAQILVAWYNRVKAFGRFARANMLTNLFLRLGSLGLGVNGSVGGAGLLVSEVVVRTAVVGIYLRDLAAHGVARLWKPSPKGHLRAAAQEFKEYPLYIFPGRWATLIALQLPVYGLMYMGLPNETGQFTMAGALLLMPLRVFGYSLYGVFLRRAIEAGPERKEELADITGRMYRRLFAVGVGPMLLIAFFADVVFRVVLGPNWALAGVFTALLGPLYLYRLLSEPLSAVFIALRSERSLFLFNVAVLLGSGAAVGVAAWGGLGAVTLVALYGGINVLAYAALSAYVLKSVGLPWARMSMRTALIAVAVALACAGLRWCIVGNAWPGA